MQLTFFLFLLLNSHSRWIIAADDEASIESSCSADSASVVLITKGHLVNPGTILCKHNEMELLKKMVFNLLVKNDSMLQFDDIFILCDHFTSDVLNSEKVNSSSKHDEPTSRSQSNASDEDEYKKPGPEYQVYNYYLCILEDDKHSVNSWKTEKLRILVKDNLNELEESIGRYLTTEKTCLSLSKIFDLIPPATQIPNGKNGDSGHQFVSLLSSGIILTFCIAIVMGVIFLRERRKRLIDAKVITQQISTVSRLDSTNSFSRLVSQDVQDEILKKLEVTRNVKFRGNKKIFIDRGALSLEFGQIPFISSEEASQLPIDASEKTRFSSPLPFATTRIKLFRKTSAHSTYINANLVSGYDSDQCFIATQSPMHNTINDFWHMIWEQNCTIVVNLCLKKSHATNVANPTNAFESQENKSETIQDTCRCTNSDVPTDETNYLPEMHSCKCIDNFQITYRKRDTCSIDCVEISTISLTDMETHLRREIRHFRYFGEFSKEKDAPADLDSFIRFVEIVQEEQISCGTPLVVHCPDGAHMCGLFISISKCIRAVCADGTCDVIRAVLQLRQERPRCLPTVEQYVYLHQALHTYASKLRDFRQQTSSEA